jgi:hypothetical protein
MAKELEKKEQTIEEWWAEDAERLNEFGKQLKDVAVRVPPPPEDQDLSEWESLVDEELRAFCPGVSPPDNSCSPANKGEGSKDFPEGSAKYRAAIDTVTAMTGGDPDAIWDRSKGVVETPPPEVVEDFAKEQQSFTGKSITPEAKKAYATLIDEIGQQYEALVESGVKVRAWRGDGEPYGDPPGSDRPNSSMMRRQIAETGEYSFFMTEKGFGSGDYTKDHPMMKMTRHRTADGEPMLANDVFRVVHDFVAHVRGGYSFSTNGEFNGMLTHASTLPKAAWPALFSETFAQNSVYETTGGFAKQNAFYARKGSEFIDSQLRNLSSRRSMTEDDEDGPLGFQHIKSRPWLAAQARAFCATGEKGGIDNSCPPKSSGKGGRAKPDRVPTRPPSRREIAAAASEGMSSRQIAARKAVASHFMASQGSFYDRDSGELKPLDEGRFHGQMDAIDWTKPVVVGPPPKVPPPKNFVQWQAPGNIPPSGGYFSTPDATPEVLGIGRLGTAWGQDGQPVVEKIPHRFEVKSAPQYIRSTAAPRADTWSIQGGVAQVAGGGGDQWFVPDAQARGGHSGLVFRGRLRSQRAFCPGASPPDNSCSPTNKGTGLSQEQARWASGMIDRLSEMFSGAGRAAAINEVITAAKYPEYLAGILREVPTKSEMEAVISWSARRGRMWEPA